MRIFKFNIPVILAIALVCASSHTSAAILSSWNFQTNTPADSAGAVGPVVASEGGVFPTSTFFGVHSNVATAYSTPTGNGSTESYSSNTWSVNDYYQISTSSLGYDTLSLTFDAMGSNTGPRDFKVQASTDGVIFSDILFTYALTNDSWSSMGLPKPESTRTTALPSSLANQPALYLRLVDTSTVAISSANPVAAGGTSRIDNILVQGTELVPEPASFALLIGCMGLMLVRRK
jgi:hypothetical protein